MSFKDSAKLQSAALHGYTTEQPQVDKMLRYGEINAVIPAEAAAADTANYVLFQVPTYMTSGIRLLSGGITAGAAVGIDATNTATLDLNYEDGAASGMVSIDAQTNATVGFAARVARAFTIVATDVIPAGYILVLEVTKAVAGTQLPDLLVHLEYEII